jgi:hypothetical protein
METPMNIKSAVIGAALGSTLAAHVSAQTTEATQPVAKQGRWELLVPSGALLPTGEQRDAIKTANISAVQISFVPKSALAITSMIGWARSRDISTAGDPKLDVFTYDVGAELRAARWKKSFTPFAGAGVGGRSYNYRKLDVDATHNLSAYASVGGEMGIRRVRVRLEARDYVSAFKPLAGAGAARTGNDVVVMAGLRLVSR